LVKWWYRGRERIKQGKSVLVKEFSKGKKTILLEKALCCQEVKRKRLLVLFNRQEGETLGHDPRGLENKETFKNVLQTKET